MSYTATIGLEVHAELSTKSKMFCPCANQPHAAEPNTHVCPVCLAHPGTLPVPNQEAIRMILTFGQAVGATPATYSEFDRKHYFYPDIPKAYQISQYAFPFLSGGVLEGVSLTRVHLEEDTARSQHDQGDYSLVDYNRAGVPLMELVTEPVIHDAETAGAFAKELQLLLRTLGISGANMERGEMRVEANISVSNTETFGTKVEVKNLNSFRSVQGAIAYEIDRQVTTLESGGEVVQETRGWDEQKLRTFSQRKKETAMDYRYFPDPDIPKLDLAREPAFSPDELQKSIPSLPREKRAKYHDIGLTSEQIEVIITEPTFDTLFEKVMSESSDSAILTTAAKYIVGDVAGLRQAGEYDVDSIKADQFVDLIRLLAEGKIGSRVAKDLLAELPQLKALPSEVAKQRNLLQVTDESALNELVAEILSEHAAVAAEVKAGKDSALQFLVGQGMKRTRGAADPGALARLLRAAIVDS